MPRPSSDTSQRTQRSSRASRTVTGPPSGEYLTAFSTRLTSTWRSCCSSAATGGSCFAICTDRLDATPAGASAPASTTFSVSRRGVDRLDVQLQLAGVEVAREQHVVDDLGEPVGLLGDDLEQAAAHLVAEVEIARRSVTAAP